MKRNYLLFIFICLLPLIGLAQVYPPGEPPNEIAGDAKITGSLQVGDIPIITNNTYQVVVDASGNFGYYGVAPTITCNIGTILFEYGTVNNITVTGHATNPIAATLTEDSITDTNAALKTDYILNGSNNYSQLMPSSFDPIYGGVTSNTYTTSMDWVLGGNSGTATAARSVNGCYPYREGAIATDLSITGNPYTLLDGIIQIESNNTSVSYTGDAIYIYFLQLDTYDTLTLILDPNGFDIFTDYERIPINVSSSALPNNYSGVGYNMYKSKTLKYGLTSYEITFKQ